MATLCLNCGEIDDLDRYRCLKCGSGNIKNHLKKYTKEWFKWCSQQ